MQTAHINENFAKLAEALYIADQKAHEAVKMCAQVERKMAQKEKKKQEEKLKRNGPESQGKKSWDQNPCGKRGWEAHERDKIWHDRQKETGQLLIRG